MQKSSALMPRNMVATHFKTLALLLLQLSGVKKSAVLLLTPPLV